MGSVKRFGRILLVGAIAIIALTSCSLFNNTVESLFDGGFKLAPEISENEIDFEITGVGTGMRGYDNFPSITLFVEPRIAGTDELITGMLEADFFDVIDDNGEARPITVTPRGATTTSNKSADIVFVIDTTGSMSSYLTTMTNKAQDFADTITDSDIDFRLGYITFGDDIRKDEGKEEYLKPTTDVATFKEAIGRLTAYGGDDGPENQIDALDYARTAVLDSNPWGSFQQDASFTYRNDALVIFVLVTDIGYHTPESPGDVWNVYSKGVNNTIDEEITKLKNDGISCYVVSPDSGDSGEERYPDLAEETGGRWYPNDTSNFADIIDDISTDITTRGDYMITFMTNDFSPEILHIVRIAIHTSQGDAQAIDYFWSPEVVDYDRALQLFEEAATK